MGTELLLAAQAEESPVPGALIVLLAVAVTAVCYYVSLKIWPFTACDRCEGRGRNSGSTRSRWGYCRKCGGSGRRQRLGVRLFMRDDQ